MALQSSQCMMPLLIYNVPKKWTLTIRNLNYSYNVTSNKNFFFFVQEKINFELTREL